MVKSIFPSKNDIDPDLNIDTTITLLSLPQHGTYNNSSFIYQPNLNYFGSDQFQYRICDSLGLCDTAFVIIDIQPVNDPPIANNDSFTIQAFESYKNINPLLNDIDVDDGIDASSLSIISSGLDIEYTIINNEISINPPAAFEGLDSIKYKICDNSGACSEASIYVTVIKADIEIYDGFSPNGDQNNDTWIIKNIESYPNNKVSIFNRYGQLVFEASGYNNTDIVWDGRANTGTTAFGDILPSGTYYYNIDLGNGNSLPPSFITLSK